MTPTFGFAIALGLIVLLLTLGVLGTIWSAQGNRSSHEGYFQALQIWFGNTGILIYLLLIGVVLAVAMLSPALSALIANSQNTLMQIRDTAKAIENLTRQFKQSSTLVEAVTGLLSQFPKEARMGLVERLGRAVLPKTA